MVVVSISVCPKSLRGDITKWLLEIDKGVYVGQLSTRVREELWKRICGQIGNGRAIIVYTSRNVQGFEVQTCNTEWLPIEFDGLTLMKHPLTVGIKAEINNLLPSRKFQDLVDKGSKKHVAKTLWKDTSNYVVIDLETTGLDVTSDDIIELAAIKIINGRIVDSFSELILVRRELPKEIEELTGITQMMLSKGKVEKEVIIDFQNFIGNEILICHNAKFDMNFVKKTFEKYGMKTLNNRIFDTLVLSKKTIRKIENYRLSTIANYLDIDISGAHRALADAKITMLLFEKLKKIVNDGLEEC